MNNSIKFLISKKSNGIRLDVYLSNQLSNFSRSYIKKIIEKKQVKINEEFTTTPSTKVKLNDEIKILYIKKKENKLAAKKMKIDIIYEDNHLLVVDKPKGMVVHPGAGNYENTLANGLVYKYKNNLSDINGDLRPGIVHRIDKDTSGLLVVAKNNLAHSKLGKQFSEHTIKRKYKCLIWGLVRPLNGRIETLISRDKRNRQLMSVSEINGKKAITNYKTIKVFSIRDIPKISLMECELETGRTHQIRVHFKFKGTSILGDKQYGEKKYKFKKINKYFLDNLENIKGQALHAESLEFVHPNNNKWLSFKSKPPNDFNKMLNFLNNLSS
tara:strand:- start:1057 stop:2037 length:981 start_codon:yes stop_codon:yes gene_type:complete